MLKVVFTVKSRLCPPNRSPMSRVVNNQLSGTQRARNEEIDYLYRLSNHLHRFSSSLIGQAREIKRQREVIVDNPANGATVVLRLVHQGTQVRL